MSDPGPVPQPSVPVVTAPGAAASVLARAPARSENPPAPHAAPAEPPSATAPPDGPDALSVPSPPGLPAAPHPPITPPSRPAPSTPPTPPTPSAPAAAVADAAVQRVLRGPAGLGTASLSLARRLGPPPAPEVTEPPKSSESSESSGRPGSLDPPVSSDPPQPVPPAEGRAVPGLYHHPVPEPDPARVEEVSRRIKRWAEDEVQLYPEEWEGQFDGFSVGRYMVACHPDAPTVDHLMLATRLMVAENAVDDCYCEDHGGSPVGLGGRLLLAHTALDHLHTTPEYAPGWAESLGSDAPRRAYRSAMDYFVRASTPSQADRYRHDMARLHMGYLAEAAWAETDHLPEVWEYLAMRQFNNFRPCPTITDTVGGYELPADLHARPDMQRVIALAGNATTIVNDLYSYTKELDSPGRHLNLPVVIAEREQLSERDAYLKAVEVHNELMHAFEAAAAELAATCPLPPVLRFLKGVAAWVDGNHYWHRTNTYRYSLPDFW